MLVTLEIVRFAQATSIMNDTKLKTDDISCCVQSSNLNEELGRVEYIFSDKTGTLTCNKMVFKKLSINDVIYGINSFVEEYKYRIIPGIDRSDPKNPQDSEEFQNIDFKDANFFNKLSLCDNKIR